MTDRKRYYVQVSTSKLWFGKYELRAFVMSPDVPNTFKPGKDGVVMMFKWLSDTPDPSPNAAEVLALIGPRVGWGLSKDP